MTSEAFFEELETQYAAGLPFSAFRKPHEHVVKAILQKDNKLHVTDEFCESGFVFAPFDDREDVILLPSADSHTIEMEYEAKIASEPTAAGRQEVISEKENHINLIQKGITSINAGKLNKVVLSRIEKVALNKENHIGVFYKLLNTYPTAFTYIWFHPKVGMWLGATPETLLNIVGNKLTTMALAGTQPFVDTQDVVWGTKEKVEQQMVVDYILSSLKPVATDIQASETITAKAGNLLHLKTQITGRLSSPNALKGLIKSLHPTPAICGLPRHEAMQFIQKNETYKRTFYTGFLGEINMKKVSSRNRRSRNIENNAYRSIMTNTSLFVNLRCMQMVDDEAFIYVGGGITKDSVPEKEWEETNNKTNTMKKVL